LSWWSSKRAELYR